MKKKFIEKEIIFVYFYIILQMFAIKLSYYTLCGFRYCIMVAAYATTIESEHRVYGKKKQNEKQVLSLIMDACLLSFIQGWIKILQKIFFLASFFYESIFGVIFFIYCLIRFYLNII